MSGLQESPDTPSGRWWIEPTDVRYIKLGPSGAWVDRCLERGVIELGHHGVPHALAALGDWEAVRTHFLAEGMTASKASDFTRELRDFYTLPASTLWITTARGRLWWAFAKDAVDPVAEEGRGARSRPVEGRWQSQDVRGAPLLLEGLSTRLTKVAAYRQTLCKVDAADYLVRRINAEQEPLVARALVAQAEVIAAASGLIQGLHWRDFELLTDLIFAASGWRRVSAVGGSSQADSDLVLQQAVTGERAMVQVKSATTQQVIDDYVRRFQDGGWSRCFFVYHTATGRISTPPQPNFHLWEGDRLAHQAIQAGLMDWLIAKSS